MLDLKPHIDIVCKEPFLALVFGKMPKFMNAYDVVPNCYRFDKKPDNELQPS